MPAEKPKATVRKETRPDGTEVQITEFVRRDGKPGQFVRPLKRALSPAAPKAEEAEAKAEASPDGELPLWALVAGAGFLVISFFGARWLLDRAFADILDDQAERPQLRAVA